MVELIWSKSGENSLHVDGDKEAKKDNGGLPKSSLQFYFLFLSTFLLMEKKL